MNKARVRQLPKEVIQQRKEKGIIDAELGGLYIEYFPRDEALPDKVAEEGINPALGLQEGVTLTVEGYGVDVSWNSLVGNLRFKDSGSMEWGEQFGGGVGIYRTEYGNVALLNNTETDVPIIYHREEAQKIVPVLRNFCVENLGENLPVVWANGLRSFPDYEIIYIEPLDNSLESLGSE
jgi:hypothetical protein